ncbi:MAG: alginate O-acetyltransferase AlgX-related protein [Trueperaceae bacterium]
MQTTATTTSTPLLRYLPAVFMLLFLSAGLVFAFLSPSVFKSPTNKKLLNGEWTAAYEAEFNQSLAVRQPSIDGWGVLEYSLFNNGRDGVLIGTNGWLFTSEEFQFYPEAQQAMQAKLELAITAKNSITASGGQLVVVLIPSKAKVYSEHLGRYTLPSYTKDVYETFAAELEAKNISVVRLIEEFGAAKVTGEVFLKTDTHWTPYGAEVAAKEIAKVVGEKSLLSSFNMTTFVTEDKTTRSYKGDLLNYLPLGSLQKRMGPAFDSLQERVTMAPGSTSGGLFGDSTLPVTLVGTSYSANALWNFEGALKEALGADVLNVANQGEGPIVPMQDYLESEPFKTTPPELVIWEIPERFIAVSY